MADSEPERVADGIYREPAQQALAAFGIEVATLAIVNVSENVTYRVDARDGTAYVLRLHRPTYHTLPELLAERAWVRALAASGVPVPRPVGATDGAEYVTVKVPGANERRHVGLAFWEHGEVLWDRLEAAPSVPQVTTWFEQLGGLIAAMHTQAVGWQPPADFVRHAVDADGFFGEAPFWGRFWDHPVLATDERAVLLRARERLHAALLRYGQPAERFSLIHADLHAGNVLLRGDAPSTTLAAIDFDDAGFGWHQYDLAVALAHQEARPDYPLLRDALLAGYRRVRAIDDAELALIPMFLLVRGLAHVGWLMQRPELGRVPSRATIDALCARCVAFEPPI